MSTFVEVAKNNGKSIEEMVDLVRKAYNANGSIGPEPSEQAVNDTKPSAVHCSPVNMNKIFSSNYMPLLAMQLMFCKIWHSTTITNRGMEFSAVSADATKVS